MPKGSHIVYSIPFHASPVSGMFCLISTLYIKLSRQWCISISGKIHIDWLWMLSISCHCGLTWWCLTREILCRWFRSGCWGLFKTFAKIIKFDRTRSSQLAMTNKMDCKCTYMYINCETVVRKPRTWFSPTSFLTICSYQIMWEIWCMVDFSTNFINIFSFSR